MSIEFEIVAEQQLIRVTCGGSLSQQEFRDYLARRDADPRFSLAFRRLMDARGLAELPSPAAMRAFAEYLATGNPQRVRIAFVASADALYGMFRMAEIISEINGFEHRAFRTMSEAEAWLNIS
ncbi:MAG TPA: hypothetical protein VF665_19315 [Longimicrobium sp.]|jgi:hypothetical protein|uniref:hypothetical protein n=1 Tax=Longimicrobium sp. TaxID=2029185 RepID=UPI002ED88E93